MNGRNSQTTAETRSHALRLVAVQALWIALAILVLAIAFAAIPLDLHLMQTQCTGTDCPGGQLGSEDVRALAVLGLSLSSYAWIETIWAMVIVLALLAVATVIFWRQPSNRMAILASFFLLAFYPTFYDGLMRALVRAEPGWYWPVTLLEALGSWLSLILLYLFPNGKFAPAQARLMVLPITAYALATVLLTPRFEAVSGITLFDNLLQFIFRAFLLVGLAAQVYRYRRLSTPIERQQTKWVLFGAALFALQDIAFPLWPVILPSLRQPGLAQSLYHFIGPTLAKTFLLLFILFLARAILRYRLWDIDLLINRTLVYVPLTAILAGLFAGSISLSQKIFIALTGQSSDVASALTTLLVVATFEPLKSGLQHVVDRRFKETRDPNMEINQFGAEVQAVVQVLDAEQLARHFLEKAVRAYDATGGAVYLQRDGAAPLVWHAGEWDGEAWLRVPLQHESVEVGHLELGARKKEQGYSDDERATLQLNAERIARALVLIQGL